MRIKGKDIKLPTRYLPRLLRTAIRFAIVGLLGMFIQTRCFQIALMSFDEPDDGSMLYFIAFTIGYIFEMIPNYILSNWYTFGTRPKWKNAGGFILARIINYPMQLGLLPVFLKLLPHLRTEYMSYLVIFVSGVVNYLICLFFFKNKKK